MQVIKLTETNSEPLLVNYFNINNNNNKVLIIVGGSGDVRNKFNNVAGLLHKRGFNCDIVTFSFRGRETNKEFPAKQQCSDLKELVDYLIKEKYKKQISIVCTSMGALSTTVIAVDKNIDKFFESIVYLDPADYPVISETDIESHTWSGIDKFNSDEAVLGNMMKKIKSNVRVHVVNFLIRNFEKSGYAPKNKRGVDSPKLSSRLNNEMVKAFYTNTPAKNRGEYVEDKKLPHAFLRDGSVEENEKHVANLVYRLIS